MTKDLRNTNITKYENNNTGKLIYSKECYEIMGMLFEVYKALGYGLREKDYQQAIINKFDESGVKYQQQVPATLTVANKSIRKYYLDFLINDKIVLEIKAKNKFYSDNIAQVFSYLKATDLKLGIIANFTKRGVQFKRIPNLY